MQAEIYTKQNCGYCIKAKQLLNSKNIPFTEISLETNTANVKAEIEKRSGTPVRTVPQVFIDDQYVGGHDDLVKFINNRN